MKLSELFAALCRLPGPALGPTQGPTQGWTNVAALAQGSTFAKALAHRPGRGLEKGPEFYLIVGEGAPELTGMTQSSREVRPGDLFLAVKGRNFDGWDFAGKAVEAGAVAVMAQPEVGDILFRAESIGGQGSGEDVGKNLRRLDKLGVPVFLVDIPFGESASRAAGLIYGRPDQKLVMVGVTGTNGKSTTAYLL